MVADGEGALVQAPSPLAVPRGCRGCRRTGQPVQPGSDGPELLEAAKTRAEEREKAEEQRRREAQARKAAANAAAYAKRLDDLAATGEAAWKQVDDMIATKKTVSVVAGRRPGLGMGMDRLGRLLHAVRPRQDAGLSAGGRDPAPRLRRSQSPGSRAHRGTASAHLREDRPARRGPGTPAAGGTGTAARRAASTARHGLGGERPGRRAAHREAAPGREDRAEPALPVRKREEGPASRRPGRR